jgi:hypothetical protein
LFKISLPGTFFGTVAGRWLFILGLIVQLMAVDRLSEVVMYFFNDYESRKEHYKDLLREAEKERLIHQALSRGKMLDVWQSIVRLVAGPIVNR